MLKPYIPKIGEESMEDDDIVRDDEDESDDVTDKKRSGVSSDSPRHIRRDKVTGRKRPRNKRASDSPPAKIANTDGVDDESENVDTDSDGDKDVENRDDDEAVEMMESEVQESSPEDNYTYRQYHTYRPYVNSYRNNDEIRIPVQSQDLYTIPGDSLIYIEGTLSYTPTRPVRRQDGTDGPPPEDDGTNVSLDNNAFAYLFDQVRYELNGVEIDRMRHVGVTSTAKTLLTCTKDEALSLESAGWGTQVYNAKTDRTFYASIPLGHLLGFAYDFKGVLHRIKQELVLVRSRTNKNAYLLKDGAEEDAVTLTVTKVHWRVPHVKFNLSYEKELLSKIKQNHVFKLRFRTWESHEFPQLPRTRKETWNLMTTNNVEVPEEIVGVLQTGRLDNEKKSASLFDHCNMVSYEVVLNTAHLPAEKTNEDFSNSKFLRFYGDYLRFAKDYFKGQKPCEPPLSLAKFKDENPMFVVQCMYEEILKPGPLDIQITMEASENFPENTSAYAILVHDVTYSYEALTGTVKRCL